MATLQGFYKKISSSGTQVNWTVQVKLNKEHEVYQGHFPGRTVAPGAALTQMVIDEVNLSTNGRPLTELRQIKFLSVIDPTKVSDMELVFEIKERKGVEMFTCVGRSGETNYFKLNGIFG